MLVSRVAGAGLLGVTVLLTGGLVGQAGAAALDVQPSYHAATAAASAESFADGQVFNRDAPTWRLASSTRATRIIYRTVGHDARNPTLIRSGLDYPWMDLRKTSRTLLWRDSTRYLKVTVSSERPFPVPAKYAGNTDFVGFHTFLDTRGGGGSDYRILTYAYSKNRPVCELTKTRHPRRTVGIVRPSVNDAGALACQVRASDLRITKKVRWWVESVDEIVTLSKDRAPNHGWYQ